MDLLEEAIAARILGRQPSPALEGSTESVLVTNQRHAECLRTASDALARARVSLENAESGELTMVDLYQALDSLGEIVGLTVDDAVLSRIFSRFCIGK
jgi:tRNA modification GTPase